MWNLSQSIQELLYLQHPLPPPIANMLRLGHRRLLKLHEDFTDIASELRIWSFYETIDSRLSGSGSGFHDAVGFGAPLVSIKSSIIGARQEQVFSLDSSHALTASFGTANRRTMVSYLEDLAAAVRKAQDLSSRYPHNQLDLAKHVKVEIIGFYEDPDTELAESAIRLYYTRYHLGDFLDKGPERCLAERLTRPSKRASRGSPRAAELRDPKAVPGGSAQKLGKAPALDDDDDAAAASSQQAKKAEEPSPDIVVTRPSLAPGTKSLPAEGVRRVHTLTVPALTSPGFHRPSSRASEGSTTSEPTMDDHSPKSGKTLRDIADDLELGAGIQSTDSNSVRRLREERLRKLSALDLGAGFSRPDPHRRKFMWIHLPFTNPPWVKVYREPPLPRHR